MSAFCPGPKELYPIPLFCSPNKQEHDLKRYKKWILIKIKNNFNYFVYKSVHNLVTLSRAC